MTLQKALVAGVLSLLLTASQASSGGFQLDRSRVLFEEGKTSVSFGVSNHYDAPALAKASVMNVDGTPSTAFASSPSIFQIPPKSTSQAQVVLLEQLPQDRESVFWLRVTTILANGNKAEQDNTIEFALAQRIKLFYRPKGLDEKCSGAAEQIRWEPTKTGIKAVNPSKVSMSLVNLKSSAKTFPIKDIVLPLSEKEWKLDVKPRDIVSFSYIDELGNHVEVPLNQK